jgi:hypothetical protein
MLKDHHGVTLADFKKTKAESVQSCLLGSIVAATQAAISKAVKAELSKGKDVPIISFERVQEIAWQRLQTFNKTH